MRLILMGTGPFAVPSFQAILENGHDVACVVTRPSVPSTNKREIPLSPVRQWATASGLSIAEPISINDTATTDWLGSLQSDLMVVCDYGQILSKVALAASKLGGINLHGSLLPRHRGAAPVQWSILAGDRNAGVSIIHMTPSLDGGPVLDQRSTVIEADENAEQLELRLSRLGVESTLASIKLLESKSSLEECIGLGIPQDKNLATKAPRLAKEDGEINCHYAVRCLDRLVRGLHPWPGTFAHIQFPDNKTLRVIISGASPIATDVTSESHAPGDLLYGANLKQCQLRDPKLEDYSLCAVALDGLLGIRSVQPAGKRAMSADEFVRGYSRFPSMRIAATAGSHRLLNQMSQFP
jgi:methionyl-tRNA formyltransferase